MTNGCTMGHLWTGWQQPTNIKSFSSFGRKQCTELTRRNNERHRKTNRRTRPANRHGDTTAGPANQCAQYHCGHAMGDRQAFLRARTKLRPATLRWLTCSFCMLLLRQSIGTRLIREMNHNKTGYFSRHPAHVSLRAGFQLSGWRVKWSFLRL